MPSPPAPTRAVHWLEHPARTALAAVISLVVARGIGLPEAYWAPLTTIVVTQSSVRAALDAGGERLAGTALGAVAGALIAVYWNASLAALAAGILVLGILCAALKLSNSAYRLAGITLIIVLIIPHAHAPWLLAWQRFLEVAIGIAVALGLTAAWPEGAASN
ncbi:MAG: FUSC family protein [Terriglobales bacterium]